MKGFRAGYDTPYQGEGRRGARFGGPTPRYQRGIDIGPVWGGGADVGWGSYRMYPRGSGGYDRELREDQGRGYGRGDFSRRGLGGEQGRFLRGAGRGFVRNLRRALGSWDQRDAYTEPYARRGYDDSYPGGSGGMRGATGSRRGRGYDRGWW